MRKKALSGLEMNFGYLNKKDFSNLVSTLYPIDRSKLIIRKIKLDQINSHIELSDFHQYELSAAKRLLVTLAQRKVFQKEFGALHLEEDLPKGSPLPKLNPIIHKGTLILGGRFRPNVQSPFSSRHPVILPNNATSPIGSSFQLMRA